MKRTDNCIFVILISAALLLGGCARTQNLSLESYGTAGVQVREAELAGSAESASFSLADVPAYSGDVYAAVNGNVPYFSKSEMTAQSFETFSDLDSLGRCGTACASVGTDLMPTEKRRAIGQVKPSGWHTVKYDFIDGKYLYNRCHLIGYQLTAENGNVKNLITGTRYLNMEGMLPFENMTADYIKETKNHVLYRVTPVFDGDNLVAAGVLMEGESVEDKGDGILFCVFVYNVQPGVSIDYATGESKRSEIVPEEAAQPDTQKTTYIFNTNTHKFHYPSCPGVSKINKSNKKSFTGTREEAIAQGYEPCGRCRP